MKMAHAFADLNILVRQEDRGPKPQGLRSRVRSALKLGYETIALNTVVSNFPEKASKKGKTPELEIPPPLELNFLTDDDRALGGRPFRILNRITLVVQDTMQLHRLTSPAVRQYDIIAVQPNAEKLMQALSNTYDVDVISFDVAETLPMFIRKPQIKLMMNHGIFFEVNYSPAIRDASVRRSTISFAKMLIEQCRGKNLILSSAAENALELRGAYDVANLGVLFGLNGAQAKDAVSSNIRSLLLHAEARRLGKGLVSVVRSVDKLGVTSSTDQPREVCGKKRKRADDD